MRYTGMFIELGIEDGEIEISEAILTDQRVAIDWVENDEEFHLSARSTDGGITYRGNYGTPVPERTLEVIITRLASFDGPPRLFAYWLNHSDGDEIRTLIELEPAPAP